ncbi:MAG: sugar phosphate isomerase/epimerase [Acidimicrobiia bacterium]|nr:sugar phosphate isomerase/epimerase [Acidimicrobiia bacterium]
MSSRKLGPAILHSVSYSGSWGQAFLSLDEFLARAAGLGFQGVMLMAKRPHLSPLDYDAAARERLRNRLDSLGLRTICLAGYTNFTCDLQHTEIPHREIQIQYVVELARLTAGIGGNLVRVFTGYDHPASSHLPQWNMVVAALKECAQRTAHLGVTIGVQNHHDVGVDYQSMFDLIQAIGEPNCRALYDAWAPALQEQDLVAAAALMAPVTAHTTIADYQLRPRYRYNAPVINYVPQTPYAQAVPMGEGFIDYEGFLRSMLEHGFSGSLAYEMCSPLLGGGSLENLDRYARKFLEYMERFRARTMAAG